jgi:hypothetical protein
MTTCRIDHYQTVDKVHVSVFAKQADKDRSAINFENDKVSQWKFENQFFV